MLMRLAGGVGAPKGAGVRLEVGDVMTIELPSGGGEDSAGHVAVALWGCYGPAKGLIGLVLPVDLGGPRCDAGGHHVVGHQSGVGEDTRDAVGDDDPSVGDAGDVQAGEKVAKRIDRTVEIGVHLRTPWCVDLSG